MALKECYETEYWLELMQKAEILSVEASKDLEFNAKQIVDTINAIHRVFGNKEPNIDYPTRVGAYIVPIRDGKVAVVKTPRGYMFLGGGIENNETDEECIVRECMEETGYSVTVGNFVCSAESHAFYVNAGYLHPIQRYYVGELGEYVAPPIERNHLLTWIAYDELKDRMLLDMQNWGLIQCYESYK